MAQIIDLGKLRFYWAGEYNSATVYEVNDVVKYGGNVYVYTYTLSEAGHTPTDADYWALMISGLKFEGVYNDATTYQVGDGVHTAVLFTFALPIQLAMSHQTLLTGHNLLMVFNTKEVIQEQPHIN